MIRFYYFLIEIHLMLKHYDNEGRGLDSFCFGEGAGGAAEVICG